MKNLILFLIFGLIGTSITVIYFRQLIFSVAREVNNNQVANNTQEEFSLQKAPSQAFGANIISVSGDVFWQSRVATQASKFISNVPIQQGEKIVTGDNGNISLELGSASLVTISPKTELAFVQTLATNFVFQQEQGTVSYTKIDQTPLAVQSLTLLTQIGSASANIITSKKDGLVTVEVNKGFVTIGYNDAKFISQVVNVEAGKKIMFDNKIKTIKIKPLL